MKLLLVDGYYYAYRSFFAIRNLSNSRGEPTNAIFGFAKAVRRMLKDLEPDLAAVVWDDGLPLRRTQLQPEYKQQRKEMPEDMVPQIEPIKALMPLLGLHNVSVENTEADDLIACYAIEATRLGGKTVIATNDKDIFQMVDESVKVYSTAKNDVAKSDLDYALLGEGDVHEKWGVAPTRILDVLALTGDAADNIPGVPGVGPKTAAKLIGAHGSVKALLADPSQIANVKLREKIETHREAVISNLEMVRLDLDIPLPVTIDQLKVRPQYDELAKAIQEFEFKTMLKEVMNEAKQAGQREVATETERQGELF